MDLNDPLWTKGRTPERGQPKAPPRLASQRQKTSLKERAYNFTKRTSRLLFMVPQNTPRPRFTAHLPKLPITAHLAAQAGVRYSIDNPRAYLDANIIGTFNLMEAARKAGVQHLLMASTSSVYGANTEMPFSETQRVATPLTFYAATKLANEAMGHSYANIYDLPITMFRFFTVYGPWGRPDMALFKFTKGIIGGTPIDIYNNGDMWRDFTYVEDLVRGIAGLIDAVPQRPEKAEDIAPGDSLSPAAPFRVVNIGNSDKVRLLDFIDAIEAEIGKKAVRNYMPMQQGDVPATWADATLLQSLTGYCPQTPFREGVARFVRWYRDYYAC